MVFTSRLKNKNVFAKCVNRAKPSSEDIIKALSAHVSRKSVLLCDGAASYNQLADTLECKKIELIGHESYDKVYHLNTVNNLHSRIKRMLGQFRGVASKYLNRYLALFSVIVSCTKPSMNEFVDELRCTLSTIRVNVILEYRNIEQTCSSVGFYNTLIIQHQI